MGAAAERRRRQKARRTDGRRAEQQEALTNLWRATLRVTALNEGRPIDTDAIEAEVAGLAELAWPGVA